MTHRHSDGQALLLVALTLGLLMTLIVGVNEIALRQRTQARIQDSLDQAAAAAVTQLDTTSLVGDAPVLAPAAVEARFRTLLQAGLTRVGTAASPDPATIAHQAHAALVVAGAQCHGRPITAPALCADITVTIVGVLDAPRVTFTTLAQATHAP